MRATTRDRWRIFLGTAIFLTMVAIVLGRYIADRLAAI
jgi:hypothetical protein